MKSKTITIESKEESRLYKILIGNDLLDSMGEWAKRSIERTTQKVAVLTDKNVGRLYADSAVKALTNAGFEVSLITVKPGEQSKDLKTLGRILDELSLAGIGRNDALAALGGGVVGDLGGFAASIHLRGISFLQVPTTLLSMVDSSVGGKTGVNSSSGKNRIGTFYTPNGVLADISVLRTLPSRELTAGLCEMVKHAAISSRELFDQTAWILASHPRSTVLNDPNFADLIAANIAFKASIVAGDARETVLRKDARSRKILNFGHTLAHALERATDYKYFKHGEAVGYGILFAAELSKNLAFLSQKDVNLLYDVLHGVGLLPSLANIDPEKVFEAFDFDKKNIAGKLQLILLKGIGKPRIISLNEIPEKTFRTTLHNFLH